MRISVIVCLTFLVLGCRDKGAPVQGTSDSTMSTERIRQEVCPFELNTVLSEVDRSQVSSPTPLSWFRREGAEGTFDGVVIVGRKKQEYVVIVCLRMRKPKNEFNRWKISNMHVSMKEGDSGFRPGERMYSSKPTLSQVNGLLEFAGWKQFLGDDRYGALKFYGFKPDHECRSKNENSTKLIDQKADQ